MVPLLDWLNAPLDEVPDHDQPGFLPGRYLKKVAKESKMGPNTQIRLAEMDEGGNVKDGVRIEMNKFYLIEMQKTPKESIGGDGKTTVEERFENNNLNGVSGGESLCVGSAPPNDLPLGKDPIPHHPTEVLLSDSGCLPYPLWRWNFSHWGKAKWN